MNAYLWIKWLHVLSATVLFGTGIGIAWFKWTTDRSGDVRAIRHINERVVMADWIFTAPAAIVQPASGIALVAGYPIASGWVAHAIVLYALAGGCWLVVLRLQWRMRHLARIADTEGSPLSASYRRAARLWFLLGAAAFSALAAVLWLMVFKRN